MSDRIMRDMEMRQAVETIKRQANEIITQQKEIAGWKAIVNKLNEDRFPPTPEHVGPVVYEKTNKREAIRIKGVLDNRQAKLDSAIKWLNEIVKHENPNDMYDCAIQALAEIEPQQAKTAGGEHEDRFRGGESDE